MNSRMCTMLAALTLTCATGALAVQYNGVYFTNNQTGWIVGGSGTILHTTNGGTSWAQQTSGTQEDLNAVTFVDQNRGCAVGTGGAALYTTDGGASWQAGSGSGAEDLTSVVMLDSLTGFAAGGEAYGAGVVIATADGGATWSEAAQTEARINGLVMFSALEGLAVDADGNALITADGGESWTAHGTGSSRELMAVDFADEHTGFTLNQAGDIFKTVDGGENWTEVLEGLHKLKYALDCVSPDTCYAAGTASMDAGGGIYRTFDGGENWELLPGGLNGPWYTGVFFPTPSTGYVVGWSEAILKTVDAGDNWQEQNADVAVVWPGAARSKGHTVSSNVPYRLDFSGRVLEGNPVQDRPSPRIRGDAGPVLSF